jgi:hypothetical protein
MSPPCGRSLDCSPERTDEDHPGSRRVYTSYNPIPDNTDLAIVLPAYRPPIDHLSEYIEPLDTQLDPDRIHVLFDGIQDVDPQLRRLEQAGAAVSPSS